MPSNDNHLSSEQFEALLACLENKDADPERKDSAKDTLRGIFEENARLREGTTKDPMTGYANFQGLREAVEQERSRIERGQSKGFVLVALDLDKFKQVNDTHGHAAGDAVIIEFANRVENRLRPVDTLCHKSGDEFWVLATNTTLAEFKPIFDQTLVEITQDPMTYETKSIGLRASQGYGEYDESAASNSFESIMAIADADMYRVKREKEAAEISPAAHQGLSPPAP
jgi:diguanylate cyclase (GGDEF)-like protein